MKRKNVEAIIDVKNIFQVCDAISEIVFEMDAIAHPLHNGL